jgi:hypothetical protein
VIVIQEAALDAVHGQEAPAVTETVPVVAVPTTDIAVGEIVKVQPPAWVTVNVRPAMVSVPVRLEGPVLAAIE